MPQSVSIELPLIISSHGICYLVQSVGFPEFALAAGSDLSAAQAVRRQVIKSCRKAVATEILPRLIRGQVQHQKAQVLIVPEKKGSAWRDEVELNLDVFTWQQDRSLVINFVPSLDLTIAASPETDVEKLVQEQIRSAIRRTNAWSLSGAAALICKHEIRLQQEQLTITVPTPREVARAQDDKPKSKTPTLNSVATRLRPKSLRPAYHRENEVQMLGRLLSADQSRSVLLIGASGVGKTAVLHQWVRQAKNFGMGSVTCWATDGSRLISGQTGFGMWQQQCLEMAQEAGRYPSVVHLGNLVELCESGRLRGSGGCGALLAPKLADGTFQAVLECTPEQFKRISRVEPRLIAALTQLRIEEPSSEDTRSILLEAAASWRPVNISAELKRKRRRKKKKRLKLKVKVKDREQSLVPVVDPMALQVLDRLHRRFRTDAAAPGRPLAFFHTVMSELKPEETLDAKQVIEAFGRQTGLPKFLIDDDVRPDLASIRRELRSQVLGQDQVIGTLVDVIATLAADLSRGDRPLASMMLIGPTGVGKTETAKALARLIYSDVSRLVRIDMSELSTGAAVGRLIGDAIHPEGILTSAVRAQPFSLILLDEFEKAHPSVFDLLLQVLGEGRLTDGNGRLTDFRNSIVLMTSNLGVDTFKAKPLGLADTQQHERYRGHFERQVREFLRPELFNRIDRILAYDPLDEDTVRRIADLRLNEMQQRDGWQSRGSEIHIESAVAGLLAKNGYQPQYGARPLAREIEKSIVVPLSEAICDSGRAKRLTADVSLMPNDSQRIRVAVKKVNEAKTADEASRELLAQATLQRRRGQALDRCEAMRQLRNEYTIASRKMAAKMKRAKTKERRGKIRYGAEAAACTQLKERINKVQRLCRDLERSESTLLTKYYRSQRFEHDEAIESLENLHQRLWTTLCELRSQSSIDKQHLTLVLTGANVESAAVLLSAYQTMAKARHWNYQVHALLPREEDSPDDRIADIYGWVSEPEFCVPSKRVKRFESFANNPSVSDENEQEKENDELLAAYALSEPDAITSLPPRTLGVMLTFRGEATALLMESEVGVHTFQKLDQPKQTGCSFLISKHTGTLFNYVAPYWLPKRDFQVTGNPRRCYDVEAGIVHDFVENLSPKIKMDREGVWLQTLIEDEMERRIWSELDKA